MWVWVWVLVWVWAWVWVWVKVGEEGARPLTWLCDRLSVCMSESFKILCLSISFFCLSSSPSLSLRSDSNTHTHKQTHTHKHTHTHIHIHTQAHTHTHTAACNSMYPGSERDIDIFVRTSPVKTQRSPRVHSPCVEHPPQATRPSLSNVSHTSLSLSLSTPRCSSRRALGDKQQASGEKRQEDHDGEEDSSQKYNVKVLKCMGVEATGGTTHSTPHSSIHTTIPSPGEEAKKCHERGGQDSAHKRQKSKSRLNLWIPRVNFGALEAFTSVEESLQVSLTPVTQ